MADDTIVGTAPDATTVDTKDAPATPVKKTRGPRRSKAVAETVAAAAATHAAAEQPAKAPRAKRGSKLAAGKATKIKDKAPVAPRARRAKADEPKITSPVETGDGFADLMALEEENKRLRKELSAKLRAENAELRRRLGEA
jgi:hypothetical protein